MFFFLPPIPSVQSDSKDIDSFYTELNREGNSLQETVRFHSGVLALIQKKYYMEN